MKDGWIRVGAVAPRTVVADAAQSGAAAVRAAVDAAARGISLLVMPELTLTTSQLGDLLMQPTLLSGAEQALSAYIAATRELALLSIVGLPVRVGSRVVSAAAAVACGKLLALVTKETLPVRTVRFAGSDVPLGSDILLSSAEIPSLTVGVTFGDDLASLSPASHRLAAAGATVLACLSAEPELVGARERREALLSAESARTPAAIVYAAAGEGESGTDLVFSGNHMIYECGKKLAEAEPFSGDAPLSAVVDTERILFRRASAKRETASEPCLSVSFSLPLRETAIDAPKVKNPFVGATGAETEARCRLVFEIAARGLKARMERAYAKTLVLGVSGGLDSTLALLVAARAASLCGLASSTVHAVTMPCFGTTARTRGNAERLCEELGARLDTIDICASVMQHFSDIGHSPEEMNVVYENAQARERTQILMDVANAEGGLVVGTGDLSELALGWATYNGDHMSMYGVNGGVPKTLLRHIVATLAELCEKDGRGSVAALLRDVLDTPVSPELLPPRDGEIAQCTEGIVGPYELHDFFLYHLVGDGFMPHKLLRLAVATFADEYDEETIRRWLAVFLRRFFSQQFKRSCLPDGPRVGRISLSPRGGLAMPSDACAALWLADLEGAPIYRKDGTACG